MTSPKPTDEQARQLEHQSDNHASPNPQTSSSKSAIAPEEPDMSEWHVISRKKYINHIDSWERAFDIIRPSDYHEVALTNWHIVTPHDHRYDWMTLGYIVAPVDWKDTEATKELDLYIRSQCKEPDEIRVYGMPGTDQIVGWGYVLLDPEGKKNVENHPKCFAIGTGGRRFKN